MLSHSGILLAYFTHTGHTREIAYQLHTLFDTDLHRIAPLEPYPQHWHDLQKQIVEDANNIDTMQMSMNVADMETYHTILLGFPNWWNALPPPVEQFLLQYDFNGKIILPFSTYKTNPVLGSERVKEICDTSFVLGAMEIPDTMVKQSGLFIHEWIRSTPHLQTLKRRNIEAIPTIDDQIVNH